VNSPILVISPKARDDLKNIYQYGVRNWGATHAAKYLDTLSAQLWSLKKHPKIGIEREDILANMRCISIERHVVFYRLQTENIEIVRVLHSRQDPQRHIG